MVSSVHGDKQTWNLSPTVMNCWGFDSFIYHLATGARYAPHGELRKGRSLVCLENKNPLSWARFEYVVLRAWLFCTLSYIHRCICSLVVKVKIFHVRGSIPLECTYGAYSLVVKWVIVVHLSSVQFWVGSHLVNMVLVAQLEECLPVKQEVEVSESSQSAILVCSSNVKQQAVNL